MAQRYKKKPIQLNDDYLDVNLQSPNKKDIFIGTVPTTSLVNSSRVSQQQIHAYNSITNWKIQAETVTNKQLKPIQPNTNNLFNNQQATFSKTGGISFLEKQQRSNTTNLQLSPVKINIQTKDQINFGGAGVATTTKGKDLKLRQQLQVNRSVNLEPGDHLRAQSFINASETATAFNEQIQKRKKQRQSHRKDLSNVNYSVAINSKSALPTIQTNQMYQTKVESTMSIDHALKTVKNGQRNNLRIIESNKEQQLSSFAQMLRKSIETDNEATTEAESKRQFFNHHSHRKQISKDTIQNFRATQQAYMSDGITMMNSSLYETLAPSKINLSDTKETTNSRLLFRDKEPASLQKRIKQNLVKSAQLDVSQNDQSLKHLPCINLKAEVDQYYEKGSNILLDKKKKLITEQSSAVGIANQYRTYQHESQASLPDNFSYKKYQQIVSQKSIDNNETMLDLFKSSKNELNPQNSSFYVGKDTIQISNKPVIYQDKTKFTESQSLSCAENDELTSSPSPRGRLKMVQHNSPEFWNSLKTKVIEAVKAGNFAASRPTKKKKNIKKEESDFDEEEFRHMDHVYEILDKFSPQERQVVQMCLNQLTKLKDKTTFLIDQLDYTPQNRFEMKLKIVYRHIFFKQVKKYICMQQLENFKSEEFVQELRKQFEQVFDQEIQTFKNQLLDDDLIQGSLTILQDKNVSYAKKEAKVDKNQRTIDYVKYLMGEVGNNQFQLRKEDFSQKHELYTKSLSLGFDEYAINEDNTMKTVANDILERVDYNQVVSTAHQPISVIKYKDNPKYAFFRVCEKDKDLALPLLAKITNKSLSLYNYKVSKSHCNAIARTCDFNPDFITKILLHNCGINDEQLSILLKGFQKLASMNQIVFRNGEFGYESIEALKPLLQRPFPSNLQVLRIASCNLSSSVTKQLIEFLKERSGLRVLALVKVNINEHCMKELSEYLAEARQLKELDLSWNLVKPLYYEKILQALRRNKSLTSINLSWNQLADQTATEKEVKTDKPEDITLEILENKVAQLSQLSFTIATLIAQIIKKNKNIQHIDLTSTNLNEAMIYIIACGIRKARSLLCIHFTNNPGCTDSFKTWLNWFIRGKNRDIHQNLVNVHEIEEVTLSIQLKEKLLKQLENYQDDGERSLARDTIKVRQIMHRKRVEQKHTDFVGESTQNKLILSRVLGYKDQMPGSGQWSMLLHKFQDCWICDQHVYTLIFFNENTIGKNMLSMANPQVTESLFQSINQFQLTQNQEYEQRKQQQHPKYRKSFKTPARSTTGHVYIYGQFTNWEAKPMIKIKDFAKMLVQNTKLTDYVDIMIQRGYIDEHVPYERLTQRLKNIYDKIRKDTEQEFLANWKSIVQTNLPFRKPCFANAALIGDDPYDYPDLYVFPTILKPGKHPYLINNTMPSEGASFHYHSVLISDIRTEEIPLYCKESKKTKEQRQFKKEHSVFNPWREDTNATHNYCLKADQEHWKVNKIIKDPDDYDACVNYLTRESAYLKDLFLTYICNSQYPNISNIEITQFAMDAKLLDNSLKMANIDLFFTSSNKVQEKGMLKNGINRSEFYEFLIRVAKFKYLERHEATSSTHALQILVEKDLKPNIILLPWQEFREKTLWVLEVNDVLHVNYNSIYKLYTSFYTSTEKYMTMKQSLQHLQEIGLTIKQAKACFGLCKMTIIDEKQDHMKFGRIAFVEYLEMLGRAAQIRFLGTEVEDQPLYKKIEYLLDMVLPMVNLTRKEVEVHESSESESDEDY